MRTHLAPGSFVLCLLLAAAGLCLLPAVTLTTGDLLEIAAPAASGILIANPPYGERLGEAQALVPLYRAMGEAMKHRFAGYEAFVLASNPELARAIGLAPRRRIVLFNGPIECRLLRFELYAGSRRSPPTPV